MKDVLLEYMKHFRVLAQVDRSKSPFTDVLWILKKMKCRTESYFVLFLKINDHQTHVLISG